MTKKKTVSFDDRVYKEIIKIRGEKTFSGFINEHFKEFFGLKKK